jgi:hypothetical protein
MAATSAWKCLAAAQGRSATEVNQEPDNDPLKCPRDKKSKQRRQPRLAKHVTGDKPPAAAILWLLLYVGQLVTSI